jgi:glucose/arabinose dehydrogenase
MKPLLGVLLCALPLAAGAQTYRSDEHSFRVVKVVQGFEQPWSLAFLPDGRMLVTEKAGRLRIVSDGKLDPRPVEGLPAMTVHGQGGLHDVVLHPEFEKNQLVYLAYAARGSDGAGTELARGRLAGHRLASISAGASCSTARATSTSRSATAARWRARSVPTTTPAR